ncbi:MAG: glycoside hydrolase family protein [Verrucomicrobiota bacterium]
MKIPITLISAISFATTSVASDMKIEFGEVPMSAKFVSEEWSIWGGSLVKGEDGLYHMFYSRWPKKLGWSWVTDSEVARAVSKSPFGPFEHQEVVLPRRGKKFWDGWCTHNPTVHKFDGKYYLYHMGNTGGGEIIGHPGKHIINWEHRNNQRIGVASADSPAGPWKRFDKPLIDVSETDLINDSLVTSNPSVCARPDGGFLFVYKGVGQEFPLPQGGPVVHCVATSESPTGPVKKHDRKIFVVPGERFPAEDPYIWQQDGKYRAIVKRIQTPGDGRRIFSLVHYDSIDGYDWKKGKYFEVSNREITWEDGTVQKLVHLERPQVFIEDGVPVALLCAADTTDENNVRHSFNVQIPLKITIEK